MRPLAVCIELIAADINQEVVQPAVARAVQLVDALIAAASQDQDTIKKAGGPTLGTNSDCSALRERKSRLFCLLTSLRQIVGTMGTASLTVEKIDQRRLQLYHSMLQSGHFNARMNALKELTQQLELRRRHAIPSETLLSWMVEKSVLSLALEGHTDKVQFADNIRQLVDFIGARLSLQVLFNERWGNCRGGVSRCCCSSVVSCHVGDEVFFHAIFVQPNSSSLVQTYLCIVLFQ